MMNIYDLQQRAEVLRKRHIEGSITPEEVGGLIADTLSLISSIEQNSSSLAVVKVYSSVTAMQGDASPVANDKPLRFGQIVSVYNEADANDAHNGEIYVFENPGWKLIGNINKVAIGISQGQAFPGVRGKELEDNLNNEISTREQAVQAVERKIDVEKVSLQDALRKSESTLQGQIGESYRLLEQKQNQQWGFFQKALLKREEFKARILTQEEYNTLVHEKKVEDDRCYLILEDDQ
jgi:ligA protein